MCSNSVASAHFELNQLRVAVSWEEKWYPTILRVICLQILAFLDLPKITYLPISILGDTRK